MEIKYQLRFSSQFYEDLNSVILYINTELKNNIAANNLLNKIETQIKSILGNPLIYKKNVTKAGNTYYRINVNNYCIFYTVADNTIVIRRLIYARRNLADIIE